MLLARAEHELLQPAHSDPAHSRLPGALLCNLLPVQILGHARAVVPEVQGGDRYAQNRGRKNGFQAALRLRQERAQRLQRVRELHVVAGLHPDLDVHGPLCRGQQGERNFAEEFAGG